MPDEDSQFPGTWLIRRMWFSITQSSSEIVHRLAELERAIVDFDWNNPDYLMRSAAARHARLVGDGPPGIEDFDGVAGKMFITLDLISGETLIGKCEGNASAFVEVWTSRNGIIRVPVDHLPGELWLSLPFDEPYALRKMRELSKITHEFGAAVRAKAETLQEENEYIFVAINQATADLRDAATTIELLQRENDALRARLDEERAL